MKAHKYNKKGNYSTETTYQTYLIIMKKIERKKYNSLNIYKIIHIKQNANALNKISETKNIHQIYNLLIKNQLSYIKNRY